MRHCDNGQTMTILEPGIVLNAYYILTLDSKVLKKVPVLP